MGATGGGREPAGGWPGCCCGWPWLSMARMGGRLSEGSDMLDAVGEARYISAVAWGPWGGGYAYVGCMDGDG